MLSELGEDLSHVLVAAGVAGRVVGEESIGDFEILDPGCQEHVPEGRSSTTALPGELVAPQKLVPGGNVGPVRARLYKPRQPIVGEGDLESIADRFVDLIEQVHVCPHFSKVD